ncbi:MAG TPA: YceI family protein [Bryobacteraceae bacterium]|jgi:polyisoprenoid-binding protein YceI
MTLIALALLTAIAFPADEVLTFDPPQTSIHFTLGTVLHTVHGTFQLKSGTIHFDPSTGNASGQLVVAASSGESGSDARDKRMKQSILEAPKFSDIIFTPDKVIGTVAPKGKSSVQVHGTFQLHGAPHDFTMPVDVEMKNGQALASAHFSIPYISWGLKNPSSFVLRVDPQVEIEIHSTARVSGTQ